MPEETEFDVVIRPAKPADLPYVSNCWLRGIQRGSYFAKRISREVFMAHEPARISSVLSRASVYVAHPADDVDTLLGFIVAEMRDGKPLIQWCYARESWRRIGIATKLFSHLGIDPNQCQFPLWSYDVNWLIERFPGAVYNPYLSL